MSVAPQSASNSAYILVHTAREEPMYFGACAATCGFELAPQTPGVDNVYSKRNPYEPDKAGDVKLYFNPVNDEGLTLKSVRKIWLDWREDFAEIHVLPQTIAAASTTGEIATVAEQLRSNIIGGAVGNMRLFSLGRIKIYGAGQVSEEEHHAHQLLDGMPDKLAKLKAGDKTGDIAAEVARIWRPAMAAWCKAWVANFRELRPIWKHAPKSFKIDRPSKVAPLVLTEGPLFNKQKARWL